MFFENAYFIIGTSYAGKSTMVKELAKKYNGIACEENYREGLKLICSQEAYDEMEKSGFNIIYRDEERTIQQTLSLAEKAFGL